jgi:glycosyltransferase involved in cell wall biosynthesis
MRILHVVESRLPTAGSVSVCLHGLVRCLRAQGIESAVVAGPGEFDDRLSGTEVVHIHGWGFPLALKAAAKAPGRIVLSPGGRLLDDLRRRPNWLRRIRERLTVGPLIRAAGTMTAVNETEARLLRREWKYGPTRVLPYGIDFAEFAVASSERRTEASERGLLVLGPLDPAHGCGALLKAFAELGNATDGWTVTLAGGGPANLRATLEAAVRRKGGESRVSFRGAESIEEQKALLNEADLLVDAGLRVSPGVSILAALASGVCVIATEAAAPAESQEIVQTCAPRRDAIREALRTVLPLSPRALRERGQAVRETARARFDWPALCPRYIAMYEDCLRARGSLSA